MCRSRNNRRRGSILIILLWMLMAMSILCISFAKSVRVEANAAGNTRMLTSAYYLAQAGINETIYKLVVYRMEGNSRNQAQDPDADLEPRDIDLGRVVLHTDIGDVTVDIADEDGKINVNRANKDLLLSLLLGLGVEEGRADIISDSILDWVDPDEDYHLNGAESDYYLGLENPYRAKNGPMDNIEELLLVRGVDAKLFYGQTFQDEGGAAQFVPGLNRCVTVYGTSAGININAAPYHVLTAIGFPPDMARRIIEERTGKPFKDNQDFSTRVPEAPGMEMLKAPIITRPPVQSSYFSLVATAQLKDSKLKKTIFAVVRLNARLPLKHTIVYWNENYFMQENHSQLLQEQE
jgi:general secretion pathway protein K